MIIWYSTLSLQQFPCTLAIVVAVIRKPSELLRFMGGGATDQRAQPIGHQIMTSPHKSYLYIAWFDEASEIKYLAQGHKHVGASSPQTHNFPLTSPALFRWTTRALEKEECPSGVCRPVAKTNFGEVRDSQKVDFSNLTPLTLLLKPHFWPTL